MSQVYWTYSTFVKGNNAVRLGSHKNCDSTTFHLFLARFISAHQQRIAEISEVLKLNDDRYTCIIILNDPNSVHFENQL